MMGVLEKKRAIGNFLHKTLLRLLSAFKKKEMFEYSAEWYDESYHVGRIGVDRRNFADVRRQYENAGYQKRLNSVFDCVQVPDIALNWLEIGAHLGMTSTWLAERFPKAKLYMFDFSKKSVEWLTREFPYKDRAEIWLGSVDSIAPPGLDLSGRIDYCTCIDVTEHLPENVYRSMIREIYRVLKPGGKLILMQGNTPNIEHIHVLPEDELVSDFTSAGFELETRLPDRHYLLRKKG